MFFVVCSYFKNLQGLLCSFLKKLKKYFWLHSYQFILLDKTVSYFVIIFFSVSLFKNPQQIVMQFFKEFYYYVFLILFLINVPIYLSLILTRTCFSTYSVASLTVVESTWWVSTRTLLKKRWSGKLCYSGLVQIARKLVRSVYCANNFALTIFFSRIWPPPTSWVWMNFQHIRICPTKFYVPLPKTA